MNTPRSVTQDDLHAYVDGLLDPAEVERIETWLAEHPEDAATVHAYRLQNRKLRQAFSPSLSEDIPQEMLNIVLGTQNKKTSFSLPWRQMAASVALLVIGGISGWMLNAQNQLKTKADTIAFVDQAVGAHHVFISEVRHPVEVPASQEAHLVKWLSNRIGTQLHVPDLQDAGYSLVGGRLLADLSRPAAQFMYEDTSGKRLTLYVRASEETEDTAFRFETDNGASAFYWIDNNFAYAMVAQIKKENLLPIATKIYKAFNER